MRLLGLSMIAQMTLFSAAFAQEPTESQPESSQADVDTHAPETDTEVQSELAEKLERNATGQTEDDTNVSDETEEVVNEMAPTEGDIASYRDTLERYSLRMKEFEKEMENNLLDPEPDEYTEFDPARHSDTKGSLPPRFIRYGIHSIYRL